jgi:uncharacterized protein (TIRG00374 family)
LKKFVVYIISMVIVSAITIYLLNSFGGGIDWAQIKEFFFHEWWGTIGLLSLLGSWAADAAVIYLLTRKGSKEHFSYMKSLKTTIIGAFFGMITPSYSGGQPMQLVYMGKSGISVGVSTSVMVLRFIVEQSALEMIAIIGLPHALRLMNKVPAVIPLAFIGFSISSAMIIFLITFSLSRKVYNKIFGLFKWVVALFRFSKKLKPKIDKFLEKIDSEIAQYAQSAETLSKDPLLLISTFSLGLISDILSFVTVYTAIVSIGVLKNSFSSLFDVLSVQSLATMIIYFSPTPGASGVAEGGFYLFFSPIVPRSYLGTVTLEWRSLTYFIPLAIGLIVVFLESLKHVKKKPTEEM